MVESESVISSDAEPTVSPSAAADPPIDNESVSPAASSSAVDRVKVPDFDPVPAAIVTSKVSWPEGIV